MIYGVIWYEISFPNQFKKALGNNYSSCAIDDFQTVIWITGPRETQPFWPRPTLKDAWAGGLVGSGELGLGSFRLFHGFSLWS